MYKMLVELVEHLEHREPQCASTNPNDIVVNNGDDKLVVLSEVVTVTDPAVGRSLAIAVVNDTTLTVVGCGGVGLASAARCCC